MSNEFIDPPSSYVQILTPKGEECVVTQGVAKDPVTGLEADLGEVLS